MQMNNQQEIDNFFEEERKRHLTFFLPYYKEKNWQVIQDNITNSKQITWDVKLEIFTGKYVLVDEKVRNGEFNDFLLELIQDIKTGNLGWFFGIKDWVLYGSWLNSDYPSSLYLIKIKELREYIYNLSGLFKTRISSRGWGITWNLILSWDKLLNKNIAEKLI